MKRAVLIALTVLAGCGGGGSGSVPAPRLPPPVPTATPFPPPSLANVQRISTDPYGNTNSQHATEVEPGAAAVGSTIVAAYQTGRFFTYGSSDIGYATSLDGGVSWQTGFLPGTTIYALPAGSHSSISDPSVAYDARHAVWLIAALPVNFTSSTPVTGVTASRSPDGMTWSTPVTISTPDQTTSDKNWIACDNHPSSPYYGHCYVEWDTFAGSGQIWMSTSPDGGLTWSSPARPGNETVGGIGGQPVVAKNGTVVVPIDDTYGQRVLAFTSQDGGATWSAPIVAATIADHLVAGPLRTSPLISAAIDGNGTIFVVWQDCRFRASCASNDLVIMSSTDGLSWSAPARIPIDAVTSTADHFIPGLAVDPATGGSGAHLGLTFYGYANTQCTFATCALSAYFTGSQDGGASWSAPQLLAGPMNLSWIAQTDQGAMVGDYMATAFAAGQAVGFSALAEPMTSGRFDEGLYILRGGALTLQSALRRRSVGEHPVPGFHADHPPRRLRP